jgi:spore germination cell wall hydrolase CwlJ-like protein
MDDVALLLIICGAVWLLSSGQGGSALLPSSTAANGYGIDLSASPSSSDAYGYISGYQVGGDAGMTTSADADTLARTIYGEARGETDAAKQGVAVTVMNRVSAMTYPGGGSVSGVCTAPSQFSCWNAGDPNRSVIESVTASNSVFARCQQIAQDAINGQLPDNTGGATYYYDTSISQPSFWRAQGIVGTVQIDHLIFGATGGIA